MSDSGLVDDGFIDIVHPETHGTARVHPDAFEMPDRPADAPPDLKALGWKKASEATVAEEQRKAERAAARRES